MELYKLQEEVAEWSFKNFPHGKPHQALLGVQEELGELCHAHLKLEQEIRNNENHMENKIDAIADIIIYLCDYCERNNISIDAAVTLTWEKVKQRDWVKNTKDGVVDEVNNQDDHIDRLG